MAIIFLCLCKHRPSCLRTILYLQHFPNHTAVRVVYLRSADSSLSCAYIISKNVLISYHPDDQHILLYGRALNLSPSPTHSSTELTNEKFLSRRQKDKMTKDEIKTQKKKNKKKNKIRLCCSFDCQRVRHRAFKIMRVPSVLQFINNLIDLKKRLLHSYLLCQTSSYTIRGNSHLAAVSTVCSMVR